MNMISKISILLLLVIASCKNTETNQEVTKKINVKRTKVNRQVYVLEVDKCEYIVYSGLEKGGIIHKENCKNIEEHCK